MIQGIDHIGIAVRSIDEHLRFYRDTLGLNAVEIETVEDQQVRVAVIQLEAGRIELLEPTSDQSPIAVFLERKGEGLHHLALATDSIGQQIAQLCEQGVRMIDEEPRHGAAEALIAFIHPKSAGGVLTELCQRGRKS
ncbi:MAG: methylmalonyl-CoA epimerase [Spirochaetaceae bacterium]|nr:MAG: methylmalonyl-CoA epimerase [Spirochaetaceae bacterium]